MSSSNTICSGCGNTFPLKDATYLAEKAVGIPSANILTLCPSCSQQATQSGIQPQKTPQDAVKHAQSSAGKAQASATKAQLNVLNPTMGNKAVCPRCGEIYDIYQPILRCKECDLVLGEMNEESHEVEWNERMGEKMPTWLGSSISADEVFARTLRWYYEKWVKPFEANPSHRIGKVKK